jgi:hypothetical protein
MALLHIEGFDGLSEPEERYSIYEQTLNTCTIDAGRISGKALNVGSYLSFCRFPVESPTNVLYLGMAIKVPASNSTHGNNAPVIFFDEVGAEQCRINFPSGFPRVARGTFTFLGTGTIPVIFDNWHYLEIKATISNSVSTDDFIIRIDGQESLNLSSGDTQGSASSSNIATMELRGGYISESYYYDDLYVLDTTGSINNTFLGDVRVSPIYPNAVGSSTEFTPSDGTSDNYTLVNDATADDSTTYVESKTIGHTDLYNHEDTPATANQIFGVSVHGKVKKSGAGNKTFDLVCQSDGTQSNGDAKSPTVDWFGYSQVFETDPATGTSWDSTGLDAAQFGVEVAS